MKLPRLSDLRPTFLKPDIILKSVRDLTPELLGEHGITCIVFDVDDTLVRHRTNTIDDTTLQHLRQLRQTTKIALYIASNSRRNLDDLAKQLDAKLIHSTRLSRKPRRKHYRRIVRETGHKASQTMMVGDRLLTDILGGNMAGMRTVLVLSRRDKFFYDEA